MLAMFQQTETKTSISSATSSLRLELAEMYLSDFEPHEVVLRKIITGVFLVIGEEFDCESVYFQLLNPSDLKYFHKTTIVILEL